MTVDSLENSGLQDGKPGQPNSGASNANQGTSGEQVVITKADFDSLQKRLKNLESEDRSKKDKAVKNVLERQERLEEKVNPLLERAAELIAKGDSPQVAIQKANSEFDEAQTNSAIRDMAQAWKSGSLFKPSAGNTTDLNVEATAVFEKYNVDPNDPEATSLLGLQGVALVDGVAQLALRRAKRTETPDSSEASGLQGKPAAKAGDKELIQKYQQDMLAARGKPALLKQIKDQARKNGVPVDTIAFV